MKSHETLVSPSTTPNSNIHTPIHTHGYQHAKYKFNVKEEKRLDPYLATKEEEKVVCLCVWFLAGGKENREEEMGEDDVSGKMRKERGRLMFYLIKQGYFGNFTYKSFCFNSFLLINECKNVSLIKYKLF